MEQDTLVPCTVDSVTILTHARSHNVLHLPSWYFHFDGYLGTF